MSNSQRVSGSIIRKYRNLNPSSSENETSDDDSEYTMEERNTSENKATKERSYCTATKEISYRTATKDRSDMKCPDCKKVCHRGGGLVNHRLNYCKIRKFTF